MGLCAHPLGMRMVNDDADSEFSKRFLLLGRALRILLRPWVSFDIPSRDAWPNPPVVICPNHRSLFDVVAGLITFSAIGMPVRLLVTERFFDYPFVGNQLRAIGAIAVSSSGSGLEACKQAVDALTHGEAVVVMPEGRVVPSSERVGGIGELQSGVALIARRSKATILPVGVTGTEHVWRPNQLPSPFRRSVVRVNLGTVIDQADIRRLGDEMRRALAKAN